MIQYKSMNRWIIQQVGLMTKIVVDKCTRLSLCGYQWIYNFSIFPEKFRKILLALDNSWLDEDKPIFNREARIFYLPSHQLWLKTRCLGSFLRYAVQNSMYFHCFSLFLLYFYNILNTKIENKTLKLKIRISQHL